MARVQKCRADQKRWNAQADRILQRLLRGPASNSELAAIALSYTRRITDLREAGYAIELERCGGGVNFYHLVNRIGNA